LASAAAVILAVAVGLQMNVFSGPADVSRTASDPALESTTGPGNRGPVRNGQNPGPQCSGRPIQGHSSTPFSS
jgi:negative regulator of sigma E activity